MRREWSPEELIESWTLLGQDWTLVGNKSGATRLGFALLLKFFEVEARFPRNVDELPPVAVTYVGEQVKVEPALLAAYSWSGRSIKYHREQIRDAFGFREFTRGDEDKLAGWLAEEVCPVELRDQQLREALLVRCRAERIEPPGRVDRIIGSARAVFEQRFCDRILARLDTASVAALEALVAEDSGAPSSGRVLLGARPIPPPHRDPQHRVHLGLIVTSVNFDCGQKRSHRDDLVITGCWCGGGRPCIGLRAKLPASLARRTTPSNMSAVAVG